MNEREPGLDVYAGRYHIGSYARERTVVERILTLKVVGDELVAEGASGETHPLMRASEHVFDAVDYPRQLQFVLGDDGVAESVIVIRDGVASEPCPRLVPLPAEIPGRQQTTEPLELGHVCLCMKTADIKEATSFYERLGFSADASRPYLLTQGWAIVAFMDWLRVPCLNFRGPSVLATGSELARRGYPPMELDDRAERVRRNDLRSDGTGSFSVYDPDGNPLFFNTNPDERASYEVWRRGEPVPGDASPQQRSAMAVPVTLPLGDLVVCLDVADLAASLAFYRGLGFEIVDRTPDSTTLFSAPARENPHALPLRLRQAARASFTFGFRCRDVEGVGAAIEARGVALVPTPDGPAFVDPDGHHVALIQA